MTGPAQNPGASGQWQMPPRPPPEPEAPKLPMPLVVLMITAIFAGGGAWVQIAYLETRVGMLERRLEEHTLLGGHREGMARLEVAERGLADVRARDDAEARHLAAKLDLIRDQLAALCAAQRPNPCK